VTDGWTDGQTDRWTDRIMTPKTALRTARAVKTILNFDESIDDGMAVAPTEPYVNHLHLSPGR